MLLRWLAIATLTFVMPQLTVAQQKQAFKPGEKLKYTIYYGFIKGGVAVLEVRDGTYEGKKANHFYLNGKTVGLASSLYDVNDTYQSFTDPKTDYPYKAIRDIQENRYKTYNIQTFDHWSRADSSIVYSTATGEVVVSKGCQDILSSFYYLRNWHLWKPLKKDEIIVIDTYFTDETYPLAVRYKGKEKIKTKLGEIECLKFMPVVITGRVFKSKDDMTIWFSNDANFIPIRVKFDIFVGSVYCDLYEYSGLKHNFSSLKQKK